MVLGVLWLAGGGCGRGCGPVGVKAWSGGGGGGVSEG